MTPAPSFLLTSDRDLLRNGLGVIFEPSEGRTGWTFGAVALQDRGLIIGVITGGTGGAIGIGYAGVLAVGAIKSIRNDERLMLAGLVILASLAILLTVSPRARVRAGELADAFVDVTSAIVRGVGTAIEWSEDARQIFALNAIQSPLSNSDFERVARTLAISSPGMAVEELSAVLPDIADVETVLTLSHMFIELESGKWALGRAQEGLGSPGDARDMLMGALDDIEAASRGKGGRPRLSSQVVGTRYLNAAARVWASDRIPTYELIAEEIEPGFNPDRLRRWRRRFGLPSPSETPRSS